MAAEGVGQKRWLQQRSLGRQIREKEEVFWEKKREKEEEKNGGVFLVFLRISRERDRGLNWSRKLRTEERRVAGKSLGHGAEKGDFQV